MKYLSMIAILLFTTAATPYTNTTQLRVYIPAVTHGHFTRGTLILDCPPDVPATVSWFATDSGLLTTNWIFLSALPGEFKVVNRQVLVPKRGVIRATMDPLPGFFHLSMTWRFAGTAVVLNAGCDVGMPSERSET